MSISPANTYFRDLHQPGAPFILANAWDTGSAKLFAALGAKALATTSAGHAFTLGVKDMGHISREQSLAHAQELIQSCTLPVSGDLENGYGHMPHDVAQTIYIAGEAGLAGCCIEDTKLPSLSVYDFDLAVERIEAGASAAHALSHDFVLTARADGVMNQQYDTDEAIRRIKAFAAVGADVLYVPLPPSMKDLARICQSVNAPVNALVAGDFARYNIEDFANIGVARLSQGSAIARLTHAAIIHAGKAMLETGDFSPLLKGISGNEVEAYFDAN